VRTDVRRASERGKKRASEERKEGVMSEERMRTHTVHAFVDSCKEMLGSNTRVGGHWPAVGLGAMRLPSKTACTAACRMFTDVVILERVG